MSKPLDGIRVIDLTNALAGASATKLLADLGADVIKVESPTTGDFTRALVPWVFQNVNRNKRSIALDLTTAEGVELVRRLVPISDVFIQSMRPGVVESMGLGRAAVTSLNPRLIHASFSAWGPSGPRAGRKGVDTVLQAESGLAYIQGGVMANGSFVDAAGGMSLAHAILASLLKRERTGEVDHVTCSLLDAAVYVASHAIAEQSVTGREFEPKAYATRFPSVGTYSAADGPLFVAAYNDRDFDALCEVVKRSDILADPRYATASARADHLAELHAELRAAFSGWPRRDLVDELLRAGVMAGEVLNPHEVLLNEQVLFNESFERVEMTDGRVGPFARSPYRFVDHPLESSRPAPSLGADSSEVLDLLGIEALEQRRLYESGVVGAI